MKTLTGIMSRTGKEEYLESCRQRYPSRNREGSSGGETRCGLERIESRLPVPMLGFDCDNGSESERSGDGQERTRRAPKG